MKALVILTKVLLIVGGLNWALWAFFDMNLVAKIFGDGTMPAQAVYALVGLAALMAIPCLIKTCKGECEVK